MEKLYSIFTKLNSSKNIQIVLLHYKKKNDNMIYQTRAIELDSKGSMKSLINDIVSKYIDSDKGLLNNKLISGFDNEYLSNKIYRIEAHDDLVNENYMKLISSIEDADVEAEPINFNKGYILAFTYNKKKVYLISLIATHKTLKRAYFWNDKKYKEVKSKYLYFNNLFDLIIYGDVIYIFNEKVERLFNMERSYKIKSEKISNLVLKTDVVDNKEVMCSVIETSKRLCFKFDEYLYDLLKKSPEKRKEIAKELNLQVNETGEIIINNEDGAKKLLELLCNRAMKNIVDNNMYRVSNAEKI